MQNIMYITRNIFRDSVFSLSMLLGENGPSLPDGPAAVEARLSQHAQLQPRCRGNAVPSVDSGKSFLKRCCVRYFM